MTKPNRRRLATTPVAAPIAVSISVLVATLATAPAAGQEYLPGIQWREPPVVTPGEEAGAPPSDAVVLFDGTGLAAWSGAERWRVERGEMVVGRGYVRTRQQFGDCQLHIEWSAPLPAKGNGQGRGNSGVFFCASPEADGRFGYEVQVLDSFGNKTYPDGQAAAVYKQTPPMVNATRPPGEWNTYDIFWTAPRFAEDGSLASPARVTALHNGVLVLNGFELLGDTPYTRPPRYTAHPPRGSIMLQDHGNPVRFRNIWVRELNPPVGERVHEPSRRIDGKRTPIEEG
ncbi:MAG: DUF1080 domain-containing protein [Planctomycetota bacterium]